jgi:hypothetical protein
MFTEGFRFYSGFNLDARMNPKYLPRNQYPIGIKCNYIPEVRERSLRKNVCRKHTQMSVRIRCINKDAGNHSNPYVAISYLGWWNEETGETGKSSREDMYDYLLKGGVAYVKDAQGDKAYLRAYTVHGAKYVATRPDYTPLDNLLRLPECKD